MIKLVVEHFGSQSELAKALGVSRSAVTQWCEIGAFPPQRCFEIEKVSNGKFKARDLILNYYGIGVNDAS